MLDHSLFWFKENLLLWFQFCFLEEEMHNAFDTSRYSTNWNEGNCRRSGFMDVRGHQRKPFGGYGEDYDDEVGGYGRGSAMANIHSFKEENSDFGGKSLSNSRNFSSGFSSAHLRKRNDESDDFNRRSEIRQEFKSDRRTDFGQSKFIGNGQNYGRGYREENSSLRSIRNSRYEEKDTLREYPKKAESRPGFGFSGFTANEGRKCGFDHRNSGSAGLRPPPVNYVPKDRDLEELYREDAENSAKMEELDDFDLEVHVEGRNVNVNVKPLENWEDVGFEKLLLVNLRRCKYVRPRRIQSAVIPLVMNGYDVLGHAETGGGKTVAFLLPMIDHIMKNEQAKRNFDPAPISLIVAPTRELVLQLYDQARKLVSGTDVTVAKVYGKYKVAANIEELHRGCDLLFATLGRLMDFVEKGKINLHRIKYFVLDEADQMLKDNSGFQEEMVRLTKHPDFPEIGKRQTLMFSATFDEEVQIFAQTLLKKQHVFVSNGRVTAANIHVDQRFKMVSKPGSDEKTETLYQVLMEDKKKEGKLRKTLVFVCKQSTTDIVSLYLCHHDIPAISIHGGREQEQREQALIGFRKGEIKVLVATDVCARGIDIGDLDHVINFDLPLAPLTYIHRIGRTGRLRRGTATSFININDPNDVKLVPHIIEIVRDVNQEVPEFMVEMASGYCSYLTPNDVDVYAVTRKLSKTGFSGNGKKPSVENCLTSDESRDNEGWQ